MLYQLSKEQARHPLAQLPEIFTAIAPHFENDPDLKIVEVVVQPESACDRGVLITLFVIHRAAFQDSITL